MPLGKVMRGLLLSAIGAGILALGSAACGETMDAAAGDHVPSQTQLAGTPTDVDAPASPRSDQSPPPSGAESPPASPFWTKYAYYVPSRFSDLPGWRDDHVAEAWKALRSSCHVLATRNAWAQTCARSFGVNA